MVKINLSYIMALRGVEKPYSYLIDLGFSHTVAQRLAHGKAESLKAFHMERLCKALYCTPNDLLEYIDDAPSLPDHHPLRTLKRDPVEFGSIDLIKQLPIDKIAELKAAVDKLMNEEGR